MANQARPSVSVLVSSFNYADFVAEAIDSALAQSEPPREVIIVDDGSTDGSPELLRARYGDDPRVRLIEQPNGGQLQAWMTGFAAASGDIVALLDSDDLWEPGYLRRIVDEYARRPGVEFVYCNMRLFGDRVGTMFPDGPDRDLGLSILLGAYFHRFQGAATSALTLRRELMARLLALPPERACDWMSRPDDCLVYGSDILGAHKVYLSEPMVLHREHGSNALKAFGRSPLKVYRHVIGSERMLEFYRRQAGVSRRWLRMAKAEFRTKPAPTWQEFRIYTWLLFQAPMPLRKRFEHWFGMLAHLLRPRRARPD
jgi:glycosyltransferase involved in cell wall biosynthesis